MSGGMRTRIRVTQVFNVEVPEGTTLAAAEEDIVRDVSPKASAYVIDVVEQEVEWAPQ